MGRLQGDKRCDVRDDLTVPPVYVARGSPGIYIYIYIYVRMHACMHVCMCVCMYVRTHVRMYVCMHVCVSVYTHTYTCMHTHACMLVWRDGVTRDHDVTEFSHQDPPVFPTSLIQFDPSREARDLWVPRSTGVRTRGENGKKYMSVVNSGTTQK